MATCGYVIKASSSAATTTSTSFAELTSLTISAASFTAGHKYLILAKCAFGGFNLDQLFSMQLMHGSTFAGATAWADSIVTREPTLSVTGVGNPYCFVTSWTAASGENVYVAAKTWTTYTAYVDDFVFIAIDLDDLGASNYLESSTTPSTTTTTYQDGASVSLPDTGKDWMVLGFAHWLGNSTSASALMRLDVGGSTLPIVQIEGEDVDEEFALATMTYVENVASSTTAKIQYAVSANTTQVCDKTYVVAINLDAFQDHVGVTSSSSLSMSVRDTYYDASSATLPVTATGPCAVLGHVIAANNGETTKRTYGRITADASTWPSTFTDRTDYAGNGTGDRKPVWHTNIADLSSGNRALLHQIAEDTDVSPAPYADWRAMVAFSLELASSGTTYDESSTDSAGASDSVTGELILECALTESAGANDSAEAEVVSAEEPPTRGGRGKSGVTVTLPDVEREEEEILLMLAEIIPMLDGGNAFAA